jgi:NAD(P)-dependent dehydrogenase (short-subunit alcohol dehydrogenase family)
MTAKYELDSRVAFVTGGSRGLGAGIVRRLAECGMKVAFCYVSQADAATALEKELTAEGYTVAAFECDVRNRASVKRVMAAVAEKFGGLDVLVNNAGINRRKTFEETTDEDWDAVIETNLKAPFICCQEALPYLKESKAGRIINISSVSAQIAGPKTAHYAERAGLPDTLPGPLLWSHEHYSQQRQPQCRHYRPGA